MTHEKARLAETEDYFTQKFYPCKPLMQVGRSWAASPACNPDKTLYDVWLEHHFFFPFISCITSLHFLYPVEPTATGRVPSLFSFLQSYSTYQSRTPSHASSILTILFFDTSAVTFRPPLKSSPVVYAHSTIPFQCPIRRFLRLLFC